MTTPFVGRAGELAALTADLDAAVGGRGGVVLVAGEPGIGKTRLAEELAARASGRGAVVLWGRCWEGAGAPAFWPWVQVIRGYVQAQAEDPASLRHDLGAGAADIAQLVPAVHDRIPDLPAPPPLEPEAARFRLFDSLAGFLRTAAARRPLLLVLDDLHWADVASLALLRFVSRELAGVEGSSPLVVGSYRHTEVDQGHPLLAAVADLTRGQHRWLLLGGLGQREVAGFMALVAGAEPSAELAAEVYRQTDGNPFFVTEVVRLLASQGGWDQLDPAAGASTVLGNGLPEGVRAVVAERLSRLSGDCRRMLEVASVVGRDFELRVLQPASGLDAEQLLVLLEEAEAARLVGAVPGELSRWRFAHALVREVLYEGLLTARRVRLHGLVADALEALYAAEPGPHLAELAHHLVEAAPGSEKTAARAVQMATLAGRRSLEVLAWEDAAGLFERALAALDLAERPGSAQQRRELLLAVGEARMAASDVPAARTAYQQAGELARRTGSPEVLAQAGLGLGLEITSGIVDPVQVGLLEEALATLDEADSPLRARVLAGLARALVSSPQVERRLALSEDAVRMARRLGDPATLAAALFGRHLAIWGSEQAEVTGERLSLATEAVGLAEQIGDRAMALRGRGLRRIDLLELGDLAGYDADLAAAERAAAELGQLRYRWQLPLAHATRALLAGRFAQAEELIERGLAASRGRRPGGGELPHRGHRDAAVHARPPRRAGRAGPRCGGPLPGHGGIPGRAGRDAGRGRPRGRGAGRGRAAGGRGPGRRAQGPGVELQPGLPGAGLLPPRRRRHRQPAAPAAGAVRRPQHRHRPRRRHLPGSGGLLPGAAGSHPRPPRGPAPLCAGSRVRRPHAGPPDGGDEPRGTGASAAGPGPAGRPAAGHRPAR